MRVMSTFFDIKAQGQGFQFPGTFEISALGAAGMALEKTLPQALRACGVRVPEAQVSVRPSKAGKYVAVRMVFIAQERVHYEQAQAALRNHPGVKWVI